MFSRTNTRKYAEERKVGESRCWADPLTGAQENIDEYCKALLKLPTKISECEHVRTVHSSDRIARGERGRSSSSRRRRTLRR